MGTAWPRSRTGEILRIVAFAYACEPGVGSESGAGWALSRMLAGIGDTWVITRANNRPRIEAALPDLPERDRLRFVYVDLPRWVRFWKRGRVGIQPYYLLWQFAALRAARRLHRVQRFDLAWHATLANLYLGSTAGLLGPRFVYGPVGGAVHPPLGMTSVLGFRGAVYEAMRAAIRGAARYANPLARAAWRRAELILVQNPEARAWLPQRYRDRAEVFHNVALDDLIGPDRTAADTDDRTAFYAGRLMPLKGLALAVMALTELPGWNLVIAGAGTDRARLQALAHRLGVGERLTFLGELPRERVLELMRASDVFVFPSLRDDAGWAVAEAIGSGVPVVCLDRGGPPVVAGGGVPIAGPRRTASDLARAIVGASTRPRPDGNSVGFEARRERLYELLERRGVLSTTPRRRDLHSAGGM